MKIKLDKIRIDGGTQPREDINEEIVSEYADAMREGDTFPPVVVFNDGVKYWLADGFHRYHASNKTGYLEIEAEVKRGTKRDAVLYSVSANSKHGLRRTNADKRKAVLTLLNDEEWRSNSTNWIAKKAKVSWELVDRMQSDFKIEKSNERKGADGRTIDTSNIGNSKKPLLDSPMDFGPKEDGGYDIDEDTGEVLNERKGIGLEKAHEAISKLKQIPSNDGLLQDAYDTVIQWINHNR
jgi:hypothetical protein